MRRYYLLSVLLLFGILGHAGIFDAPAFKIQHGSIVEFLKLRKNTISADTTLLLDLNNQIAGMAISGKTILANKEAIVRVLLIDKNGKEYLVFEDMYLFPDDSEHEFTDVAMETAVLENIIPEKIKIFVQNAQIELSRVSGVLYDDKRSLVELYEQRKNTLAAQEEYLIEQWNRLNAQTGQYWVAGKTSISGLPYSDKKIILGAIDDHYLSDGIEYYVGGLFVVKAHGESAIIEQTTQNGNSRTRDVSSTYTANFDWRNRHGKNWMTSVKNQRDPFNSVSGNGGCWVFGTIAALESRINLYYNQLLNADLSEQEIGSCTVGSLHTGGNPTSVYAYIRNNGVVNEACFPFVNDDNEPCENKCTAPAYVANISDYSAMPNTTDQLKSELIQKGPLASGYRNGYTDHEMCLCGYGTIEEGTHIEYAPQTNNPNIDTIVPATSNLIGKTYWIYKNSYGLDHGFNGYAYIVFENDNTRKYSHQLPYPVTISSLTTSDIVCEDADNDGYYFWGLGQKPDNCPICCPDTPDGDDSNPQLAEMDNYGNFATYVFPYSTTTISSSTSWNSDTTHCGNIVVTNNAILTITAQLTMNPAAKIIVQNGGKLVVDTGCIVNANVDIQASAGLDLLHNGTLYLKQYGNLNVRLGAEANMEYGCVLLQ